MTVLAGELVLLSDKTKRTLVLLLAALALALLFSFEVIMLRPMDSISAVWFGSALVLLTLVMIEMLRVLAQTFRSGRSTTTLDITYSVVFLALPCVGGLLIAVAWNLVDYVQWWTSLP
mgnify:CR=1 FL=1